MFSTQQKREIADAVQKALRTTGNLELPPGEIQFALHVWGEHRMSWADIRNNGAVPSEPGEEAFYTKFIYINGGRVLYTTTGKYAHNYWHIGERMRFDRDVYIIQGIRTEGDVRVVSLVKG